MNITDTSTARSKRAEILVNARYRMLTSISPYYRLQLDNSAKLGCRSRRGHSLKLLTVAEEIVQMLVLRKQNSGVYNVERAMDSPVLHHLETEQRRL